MYLMYFNEEGKRVYTLKKVNPSDKPTESAHPARFSPDDKFSRVGFSFLAIFVAIRRRPFLGPPAGRAGKGRGEIPSRRVVSAAPLPVLTDAFAFLFSISLSGACDLQEAVRHSSNAEATPSFVSCPTFLAPHWQRVLLLLPGSARAPANAAGGIGVEAGTDRLPVCNISLFLCTFFIDTTKRAKLACVATMAALFG